MNEFGRLFRDKRVAKRITLREISEAVGKSIGYLSDIEHGRKGPPDLETVKRIEETLGINDHSLLTVASKLRSNIPAEITQRIQMRPRLAEMLLRADKLSDEELDDLIPTMKVKGE